MSLYFGTGSLTFQQTLEAGNWVTGSIPQREYVKWKNSYRFSLGGGGVHSSAVLGVRSFGSRCDFREVPER